MPGILKSNIFSGKQKPYNAVHHLCSVKFLDNSDPISVTYERSTKGRFLLDHVCSSIDLIEKDYFGLKYTDGEKQECWMDPEKTIHSQIKDLSNPVLYFQVKYYPSELDSIKEEITRYQLFLQVRKDFNESRLICSLEKALQLSAYIVQDEIGNYDGVDDLEKSVAQVKLPPALKGYEGDIINMHKQLKGLKQSRAEYKFLTEAASLNSYGIDPYIVSDEKGVAMYLAISPTGIITFEDNQPTKVYLWKDIWKLSFDGKMFHIRTANGEHFSTSLFACTSANKKPMQQSTATYKCLSHANCKQLWKNAMAYKYFYTLESSSDAPKVLSSGGMFIRGSKFRYSGNCLEEIRRSSASINREEPQVSRHLSNVQIDRDSRCSTLPHRWKPNKSIPEDTPVTKLADSMLKGDEAEVAPKHFVRRTSSDSALEKSPSTSDLKNPLSSSEGDDGCSADANLATHRQVLDELPSIAVDVENLGEDPSAPIGHVNVKDASVKTDDCDDDNIDGIVGGANDEESSKGDEISGHPAMLTPPEPDLKTVGSHPRDAVRSSETEPFPMHGSDEANEDLVDVSAIDTSRDESKETIAVEGNPAREEKSMAKRKRQESNSGCDTGYASSGSERLSRSFESDEVSTMRSNGILEEMEFPPDEAHRDDGLKGDDGPLMREQLLSMLSYGFESLDNESDAGRPKDCGGFVDHSAGIRRDDATSSSTLGDFSPFSYSCSSSISNRELSSTASPNNSSLSSSGPPSSSSSFVRGNMPDQNSLLSGVFSSDNFKRIKEIEKMIEDNKSKILLMKEAISSEIKRSTNNSSSSSNNHINDNNAIRLGEFVEAPSKQAKRVSFSSHDTEWYVRGASIPFASIGPSSWSVTETFNKSDDRPCSSTEENVDLECWSTRGDPGLIGESKGEHSEDEASTFVEKIPFAPSADGTLVTEAELCKFSDNSGDTDDTSAVNSVDDGRIVCRDILNVPEEKVLRSEGSGGSIYLSSSIYSTEPSSKHPVVENKVEQFSFSETVVEEVVKFSPEIFEAISLSLQGAPAWNLPPSEAVESHFSPNVSVEKEKVKEDHIVVKSDVLRNPEEKPSTEDLHASNDVEIPTAEPIRSYRSITLSRRLWTTLLSVALSLIFFAIFLIVIFELDQEIPYVTDQESIIDFKELIYTPARKQMMKLFQE